MNDVAQAFDPRLPFRAAGGTSPLIGNDDKGFPTNDAGLLFIAPAPGGTTCRCRVAGCTGCRSRCGVLQIGTQRQSKRRGWRLVVCGSGEYDDRTPDYVVVASGESFADGLTGGVLASFCDGPLLLTTPNSTARDIRRDYEAVRARFYGGGIIRFGRGRGAWPMGLRSRPTGCGERCGRQGVGGGESVRR